MFSFVYTVLKSPFEREIRSMHKMLIALFVIMHVQTVQGYRGILN